jgi:YbgC/YbaW family acyl-CoA thioester hydrolase
VGISCAATWILTSHNPVEKDGISSEAAGPRFGLNMNKTYSQFETEMPVRPDDIDMNRHVHGSRYFDYVLAARYEQMGRCYKMSMEEFLQAGFNWVIRAAHIEYKRPLGLGDSFLVRTRVEEFFKDGVRVRFEIVRKSSGKQCCDGYFDYTMVSLETGRGEKLPDWIVEKYSV